jgi:hypothetical protein
LGVFRVDRDNQNTPGSHTGNLVGKKKWIIASWDTIEQQKAFGNSEHTEVWRYGRFGIPKGSMAKVHALDVFYLPVRIMDADPDERDWEAPMISGLLLLPTRKKNGEFRRVGQFEMSEHWEENSVRPLAEKTDILDPRFFISKHNIGDYTISIV